MIRSFSLFSQNSGTQRDTTILQVVVPSGDTVLTLKRISPDAIDKQVIYSASGYIKNDLISKQAILRGAGKVDYGDIQITADSIVFNMQSNVVYAVGISDSAGNITGKPVFKSGSQEFSADTLRYNFKTGKAVVRNIVTKQDEGLLHSSVTKLMEDGTSNIFMSTYSTCDADTPHFYIHLPKARVYPGKKIISGPGNLVLEGIPLPLYIPFGYFPVQTKTSASGILIPRPHYEANRGYALTEGGYYFAINDYLDLALKGNFFTNGSWMATATTNYYKLYKYRGSFTFSYANNISGHKGLPDFNEVKNYSLGWNYSQDSKARPGSRFSASVNMSSSGFDRNNSYNVNDHITTTRQSSISYSKTWEGTPFNFSASMNHSQNVKNKTILLNLPKANFSSSRIYPFRGRNSQGTGKWYQDLQFQYTASVDNQINTYDSLLFTSGIWKDMNIGFTHEAPLSFQIRPFRNFTISPQLSYKGVLYASKIIQRWDPEYINPETNQEVPTVVNDTIRGVFYGHAINPSISAGYSPQIFGIYQFINPESRVQAIRHVIKPSIGFNYVPDLKNLSSKMYRQVQIDTAGNTRDYSIYQGNIFGTPSLAGESGNISLALTNILEAKVFERDDTSGKPRTISLIDNFGISTSYNIFADSLNWAPLSMVVRTTLFGKINISGNSNFSLYGLDSKGAQTGTLYFTQTKKLMRLNSAALSVDFNLSDLLKGKEENNQSGQSMSDFSRESPVPDGVEPERTTGMSTSNPGYDEFGYSRFDMPWTMNLSYSLNYSKPSYKSFITQSISANGNVTVTKKMNLTYTSGYDFTRREITMTQIQVTRDLHCWTMSFSWIPNGYMKMWEFAIRVKASVLADLKYERRKDYHDNY